MHTCIKICIYEENIHPFQTPCWLWKMFLFAWVERNFCKTEKKNQGRAGDKPTETKRSASWRLQLSTVCLFVYERCKHEHLRVCVEIKCVKGVPVGSLMTGRKMRRDMLTDVSTFKTNHRKQNTNAQTFTQTDKTDKDTRPTSLQHRSNRSLKSDAMLFASVCVCLRALSFRRL